MHCTICTICTLERESAESAESAMQKNNIKIVRILRNLTFLSANFYRTGMASRATKEEDVAFMYRELPSKKNRLAEDAKRKRDGMRAKTMDFAVVANNLPKTDVYIPKKSMNFFAILNGARTISHCSNQ